MPVGTGGLLSSAIFSPLVFSSTAAWSTRNAPSKLARFASPFFMRNRWLPLRLPAPFCPENRPPLGSGG